VPQAYASAAGIIRFLDFALEIGSGHWADFFAVELTVSELSVYRPFYPAGNPKKGQAKQDHVARIKRRYLYVLEVL
jgi:hypothetical protein